MDNDDKAEDQSKAFDGDIEVKPSGLLAGNLAAANMGSSTVGGLGGGPIGALAVDQAADTDTVEDEPLNLDALSAFGNADRQTGDDGVSPAQQEAEASELNG